MNEREITQADTLLLRDLRADTKAWTLLMAKCHWENMSPHAVVREWGDPRTWPAFTESAP